MVSVTFKVGGTDVVLHASKGDNLLAAAQRANVAIDAPCSGNGACGKCRVKLLSGALDSPQTRHISDEEYAQGWRLSCVSRLVSDVTVEVPDIASAYRSRMKVADISSEKELAIFNQTKAEIVGLAESLPFLHFVAWDVVKMEDGTNCIIEANTSSGVNIIQLWGGQRNGELGNFYRRYGAIR